MKQFNLTERQFKRLYESWLRSPETQAMVKKLDAECKKRVEKIREQISGRAK